MAASFSVYIIESPSPADLMLGRSEGDLLSELLRLADVPAHYRLTVNSLCFTAALFEQYLRSLAQKPVPSILHISAHGSTTGFQLTDGTMLEWQAIAPVLRTANSALGGNLIVCMSSCEGFFGGQMALSADGLPFHALVGHKAKPTWSDTAVAFATFYHLLAKRKTVNQAVAAMSVASGDDGFLSIIGADARNVYMQAIENINPDTLKTVEASQ